MAWTGFNAPKASFGTGFGASASKPAFGATTGFQTGGSFLGTKTVSSPQGGLGGFGGATTSAFGAPVGGGATSFGRTTTNPPMTPFGAASSAGATTSFLGSPSPTTGAFGQTQTQLGFGGGGGGAFKPAFGTAAPVGTGMAATGTGTFTSFMPFQTVESATKGAPQTQFFIQSISAMKPYEMKSFEEIRFEDYKMGNKGGTVKPAFGAGTFGGTTTSGFGFGASGTTTPFGVSAATTTGTFGAAAPAFGAPAGAGGGATTGFGGGMFGAPATGMGTGTFGSTSTGFGGTSAFGTSAAPGFGASAFGATAAPSTSGFGGSAFGSTAPTTTSAFGLPAASTTSAFGGSTTSAFGGPTSGAAPFGTTGFGAAAPAFGTGGSAFGATAAPAFGSTTAPSTGFAGFGNTTGTTFGGAPSTSTGFGGTTTGFGTGTATTSAFGQSAAPTTSAFGGGTSAFGGGTSAFGGGTSAFGQPTTTTATTGFGAFGQQPAAATTAFGSGTSGFGASSTGGFGGTSAFGLPTATATFGNAAPTTSGFGSNTFGIPTATAVPVFGASASSAPSFGSTPTGGGFGTGGFGTGGFGGTSAAGGFGFGKTATFGTAAPAAAAPAVPSFASAAPTTTTGFGMTGGFGSAFGAKPATTSTTGFGFGQATTAPSTTSGFGFGTSLTPATSGGGGGFTGFGFGASAPAFGATTATQPIPLQSGLSDKIAVLSRKRDEMEIYLKDDRLISNAQMARVNPEPSQLASQTGEVVTYRRNVVPKKDKVMPRGYHSNYDDLRGGVGGPKFWASVELPTYSKSTMGSFTTEDLGKTTSFGRTDHLLSRKSKTLVIGPQFHQSGDKFIGEKEGDKSQSSLPADAVIEARGGGSRVAATAATATPMRESIRGSDSTLMDTGFAPSAVKSIKSSMRSSESMDEPESAAYTPHSKVRFDEGSPLGDPTGLTPGATKTPEASSSSLARRPPSVRLDATPDLDLDGSTSSAMNTRRRISTPHPSKKSGLALEDSFTPQSADLSTRQSEVRSVTPSSEVSTRTLSQDVSPAASASPRRSLSVSTKFDVIPRSPVLLDKSYETFPSMTVLGSYSDEELSSVPQFAITRAGFGKIEWPGETDVRGLALDSIVRIKKNCVEVYENDDAKPEIGRGLNKPAIITLQKVFPKASATAFESLHFEDKLRKCNAESDAEFIDYNPVTGDWTFQVEHFSKYGLEDSDDDEVAAPTGHGGGGATKRPSASAVASSTAGMAPSTGKISDPSALVTIPMTPADDIPSFSDSSMLTSKAASLPKLQVSKARVLEIRAAFRQTDRFSETTELNTLNKLVVVPPKMEVDEEVPAKVSPVSVTSEIHGRSREVPSLTSLSSSERRFRIPSSVYRPAIERLSHPVLSSMPDDSDVPGIASTSPVPNERSPCLRILENVRRKAGLPPSATKPESFSSARSHVRRPIEMSLFMGRSFRVSWGPNGQIAFPSSVRGQVVVENIDFVAWARGISLAVDMASLSACYVGPLLAQFTSSLPDETPHNRIPRTVCWRAPIADLSSAESYGRFLQFLESCAQSYLSRNLQFDSVDWRSLQFVQLVNAAIGQEVIAKGSKYPGILERLTNGEQLSELPFLPMLEHGVSEDSLLWMQRQEAISQWLQSFCSPQVQGTDPVVDSGEYGQQVETFVRIFRLLTVRRLQDAAEVAESAGLLRLATLISQADGDNGLSHLLQAQLTAWKESEAEAFIPPELLDVYRLLGGLLTREQHRYGRSILTSLGWARAVAIFFWFCRTDENNGPNNEYLTPMAAALLEYKAAMEDGDADVPVAWYAESPDLALEQEEAFHEDFLYHALQLFFSSKSAVREDTTGRSVVIALQSESVTKDSLDYRNSALVIFLLHCAGLMSFDNDMPCCAALARQHYIFQLLSVGLWKWAIFVVLQLEDSFQRDYLVKEILFRYAGVDEFDLISSNVDSPESFAIHQLHVPAQWVHEAAAYRRGYDFNFIKKAQHFNFAGMWRESCRLVAEELAPLCSLQLHDASQALLSLLDVMYINERDPSCEEAAVLRDYLAFRRQLDIALKTNDANDPDTMTAMYETALELLRRLSSWASRRSSEKHKSRFEIPARDMSTFLFDLITQNRSSGIKTEFWVYQSDELNHAPIMNGHRLAELQTAVSKRLSVASRKLSEVHLTVRD